MKRFVKRTVIVTGGARGMGASYARGFVAEGANVLIADVLDQEGRTLANELGHQRCSPTSTSPAKPTGSDCGGSRGRLRPGLRVGQQRGCPGYEPIAETEPAAWRRVIDINLTGQYLGIRAVVPSMRKAGSGAIVNISSTGGIWSGFGTASYAASSWACAV